MTHPFPTRRSSDLLQRALGDADDAHAVMDASRSEAALGDLEAAALTEQQVLLGHADVLELELAVAVRAVVEAHHVQHAPVLDARGVDGHDDKDRNSAVVGKRASVRVDLRSALTRRKKNTTN